MSDALRETVMVAIGEASVCWDEDGVFQPDKAIEIGERLISFVEDNYYLDKALEKRRDGAEHP